ncbi:MAG TPA: type II toxin-antitoxin system RelE/ParE family toxin [Gammaproteobacteria bacterium]|nr:type II toxin-antitoxin system RelE/ParE family toxin [Gammaproteobacteria bacterium]
MTWTVETLNAVVDVELDALPVSLRARLARIVDLIKAVGLEHVHEPHVAHIEGKLWEIRAKAREGIARAIYITVTGQRVIILHAFVKKKPKTPAGDLNLARRRLREVKP